MGRRSRQASTKSVAKSGVSGKNRNVRQYSPDRRFQTYPVKRQVYPELKRQRPASIEDVRNAFLPDNPKVLSAARSRLTPSRVYEVPGSSGRVDPRTLNPVRGFSFPPIARSVLICLGRKVRRELVFSHGGAGSSKKVPNRRSPSKERC